MSKEQQPNSELDELSKIILKGQNPTSSEGEKLKTFFPEGCFFNWDGVGNMPIGSLSVMRGNLTIEKACEGCRIYPCEVRKASFTRPRLSM